MTKHVDFRATTSAVLKDFNHGYTDMVINLLEKRNTVMTAPDSEELGVYADFNHGYGLLVMADDSVDKEPLVITTEFLVPSNDLAASFMVLWRRWCDKRGIRSSDGLLLLMDKVIADMRKNIARGYKHSKSNLSIGLMGAVLDKHPGVVDSMRWSVDNGFAPCLVIARDDDSTQCGVCYGGKYK
ncbi:MAG TPA: hypothetical protein ENJ87_02865 [Gammaproteobacteria bacterium]|nr:hypothetical protein [Gammaproteobacteria bacterium]